MSKQRIILDNGGGVTLQLRSWAHYYGDGWQAGRDLHDWLLSGSRASERLTDGWEGHDQDALACSPTPDEIRNGGYRVVSIGDDDTAESLAAEIDALNFGYNGEAVASALRATATGSLTVGRSPR